MTVEIRILGESAIEALNDLRTLTRGLEPDVDSKGTEPFVSVPSVIVEKQKDMSGSSDLTSDCGKQHVEGSVGETSELPKRERGKPSQGRARRTKEEIAEDEAAEAANEPAPNISTDPENRVDPADAAQDAADEAADEANASGPETTREDVRGSMKAYMDAFGLPALNADMSHILNEEYPSGDVTKLSEIPENAADFANVKARLDTALKDNEFKRERV